MDGLNYNVDAIGPASQTIGDCQLPPPANRFEADSPAIGRIYVGAMRQDVRVLAIVGCAAGGSQRLLADALATRSAQAGDRTLLLDLVGAEVSAHTGFNWSLGNGSASSSIQRSASGYERLSASGASGSHMRLRNLEGLRRLLNEELAVYRNIIVLAGDLAPGESAHVPAATAVQACDALVLVVIPDRIARHDFELAIEALGPARDRIAGLVVDDTQSPSVGEQLSAKVQKWGRRLPRLASFLQRRIAHTGVLWAGV